MFTRNALEITVGTHAASRRKKIVVTTALVALLVGGGGAAYAFWTTSGAGTGAASAAASVAGVVVKQTSTVANLAPGSGTQPLTGNFDNANSGPVQVTTVTVASLTVTKASGAPAGTCDQTDYTVVSPTTTSGSVPAGTAQGSWSGGTIAFNNKTSTNQDACKGATVVVNYTAS